MLKVAVIVLIFVAVILAAIVVTANTREDLDDDERLIEIRSYFDMVEADFAKTLLDGSGVFSFLKDQHTNSVLPLHSIAIGGIKLMVRRADLVRAQEILDEYGDYTRQVRDRPTVD